MSVWDDPSMKVGGNYVTFDNPGDFVSGTISLIRPHVFNDGSVAAQLFITTDNGEEVTVTAGQIKLKIELVRLRPEAGDHIMIRYAQKEQRAGGKTLKHFEVQVTPGQVQQGGYQQPQQPQQYAPQQQPFQQAPTPAQQHYPQATDAWSQPQQGQQPPAQPWGGQGQQQAAFAPPVQQQPPAGPGPFQQAPQPAQPQYQQPPQAAEPPF
ncbi:hypothetical protein [Arthrobacter sp. HY1533]|uniref:hypothetical protein n=1 Tax=Arthrobacter sp. HY1533 TaxID=2970919 RepID=UPI0022BA0471|nr:hypothetical protein [Arthrobacter sp. HY1533]